VHCLTCFACGDHVAIVCEQKPNGRSGHFRLRRRTTDSTRTTKPVAGSELGSISSPKNLTGCSVVYMISWLKGSICL
jgi:hypothetical protein